MSLILSHWITDHLHALWFLMHVCVICIWKVTFQNITNTTVEKDTFVIYDDTESSLCTHIWGVLKEEEQVWIYLKFWSLVSVMSFMWGHKKYWIMITVLLFTFSGIKSICLITKFLKMGILILSSSFKLNSWQSSRGC